MRGSLKTRNLKILSKYHELTLSTKKLEKQKHIEIAEEMDLTKITVKRVIDRYYSVFLDELGTKNTCLEGLTELREKFKFENLTDKAKEYIIFRLFGNSDTQATKKAGYKSKGSITKLKRNKRIQDIIEAERLKTLEKTRYTFDYNYNSLGYIADKAKNILQERSVSETQGGKNGAELNKTVNEKYLLGVSVSAFATMNKMIGFNYEDVVKTKKVEIEKDKLELEKDTRGLLNEKLRRELAVRGDTKEDVSITAIRKKYGL